MKYFTIIFLFISSTSAIFFECTFYHIYYDYIDFRYACEAKARKVLKSRVLKEVTGSHRLNRTNENVSILIVENKRLNYIPKGVVKYFPNLIALDLFNCSIKNLQPNDLSEYEKLQFLDLGSNEIENVPENFFKSTSELVYVDFNGNKIRRVGENIFSDLRKLQGIDFSFNECVDEFANDTASVEILMKDLEANCSNDDRKFGGYGRGKVNLVSEKNGETSIRGRIGGEDTNKYKKTSGGVKSTTENPFYEKRTPKWNFNFDADSSEEVSTQREFNRKTSTRKYFNRRTTTESSFRRSTTVKPSSRFSTFDDDFWKTTKAPKISTISPKLSIKGPLGIFEDFVTEPSLSSEKPSSEFYDKNYLTSTEHDKIISSTESPSTTFYSTRKFTRPFATWPVMVITDPKITTQKTTTKEPKITSTDSWTIVRIEPTSSEPPSFENDFRIDSSSEESFTTKISTGYGTTNKIASDENILKPSRESEKTESESYEEINKNVFEISTQPSSILFENLTESSENISTENEARFSRNQTDENIFPLKNYENFSLIPTLTENSLNFSSTELEISTPTENYLSEFDFTMTKNLNSLSTVKNYPSILKTFDTSQTDSVSTLKPNEIHLTPKMNDLNVTIHETIKKLEMKIETLLTENEKLRNEFEGFVEKISNAVESVRKKKIESE